MFSLVALGVLLRKALFTPRLPKICLCSLLAVSSALSSFILAVLGLGCCRGFSLAAVHELLIAVASQCMAQALGCTGFRSHSTWALSLWRTGSRAQAQSLCTGLAAPCHVGRSQIRDRTHVSCTGK